jgi:phosphoglycolate phosphatase-like HAD superfamily hydrolase
MKTKKLIVFDMDGVLIDVSGSYRDTVRQTVGLFFSPSPTSVTLPEPLFELSDLAAVKQSGGLNNDWDLTYTVINLLYSLVDKPISSRQKDPWLRFKEAIGRLDVLPIADFLKSTDKPLSKLLARKGRPEQQIIAGLYTGDVGSGNIVKQIFQEIYLGNDLFEATYRISPAMYTGEGYILREKVLIDRPILEALSRDNILAIATGRPRAEAEYPLAHFGLNKFFTIVYTLDECIREEKRILREEHKKILLSKPHPYMLDAIAETIDEGADGYYYVGDMPDDMLAAKSSRTGFAGIGLLLSVQEKEILKENLTRAGADYVVDDFDGLRKLLDRH